MADIVPDLGEMFAIWLFLILLGRFPVLSGDVAVLLLGFPVLSGDVACNVSTE